MEGTYQIVIIIIIIIIIIINYTSILSFKENLSGFFSVKIASG